MKIYRLKILLICSLSHILVDVPQCTNQLGPFTQMATPPTQWAQRLLHRLLITELAQRRPEHHKHLEVHQWRLMQLPRPQVNQGLFQTPCQI